MSMNKYMQINSRSIYKMNLWVITSLLLFSCFILMNLLFAPKAEAGITSTFPRGPSAGGNAQTSSSSILAVSSKSGECGSGCYNGLDAVVSDFKIFRLAGQNGDFNVTLEGACGNPYGGNKGNTSIRVETYKAAQTANGTTGSAVDTRTSVSHCSPGSNDLVITVSDHPGKTAFSQNQSDSYGFNVKTAILSVVKIGGGGGSAAPGLRHFRVNVPGSMWVSFDDIGARSGSNNYVTGHPGFGSFALDDANGSNGEGTYEFTFKPDCKHINNAGKPVVLKWSDADAEEPSNNLDSNIQWNLTPKGVSRSGAQLGGQGWNAKSHHPIGPLAPEQSQTWKWSKVNANNGVQLWIPFSEGSILGDCPPTPPPPESGCDSLAFPIPSNNLQLPSGTNPDRRHFAVYVNDNGSSGIPPDLSSEPPASTTYQDGTSNWLPPIKGQVDYGSTIDFADADPPGIAEGRKIKIDLITGNIYVLNESNGVISQRNTGKQRLTSGTLQFTVIIYNNYQSGSGTRMHVWQRNTTTIGGCYQAACSVDIIESDGLNAPNGSNAVKNGENFDAVVTITNTSNHHTLPLILKGVPLGVTTGSGDWAFRIDRAYGSHLSPHQSTYVPINLPAQGHVGTQWLNPYPDFFNVLGVGGACNTPVNVYQRFKMSINNSLPLLSPTDEDATQAQFGTTVIKDYGPDVSVTTSRSFTAKNMPVAASSPEANPDTRDYGPNHTFTDTYSIPPGSFRAGDQYCVTSTINRTEGWRGPGGTNDVFPIIGATSSGPSCSTIYDRPYLTVYGADAVAGSGFKTGETCSAVAGNQRISAFRSGVAGKAGSSAQFAAMALDQISGFMSSSLRSPPTGLTFANIASGSSQGVDRPGDGGGYGGARLCAEDFFGNKDSDATISNSSVDIQSIDNEKATEVNPAGGIVTITNSNPANFPKNATIYVNGSAIISHNIAYGLGNNFKLIVSGNIYIEKNVTRLDGAYIAQPSGDGTGNIYTCSLGTTPYQPNEQQFNNCNQQLVINGAFVAKSVKFLRVFKSLRDSRLGEVVPGMIGGSQATNAAEVFNFSPEIYLFSSGEDDPTKGQDSYDFITTLPPVL